MLKTMVEKRSNERSGEPVAKIVVSCLFGPLNVNNSRAPCQIQPHILFMYWEALPTSTILLKRADRPSILFSEIRLYPFTSFGGKTVKFSRLRSTNFQAVFFHFNKRNCPHRTIYFVFGNSSPSSEFETNENSDPHWKFRLM